MAKRRKYSYNERKEYHEGIFHDFVSKTSSYEEFESRLKKQPKIQFSDGYTTFTGDIQRGYIRPMSEVNKKSLAFQRGFKAAKSAYEKSRNIKF